MTGTSAQRRQIEDRFINEWGLLATAWGVSPLLGRIHGLLLLVGRPMTAEEVCERLDISRASASVQLNAILGWGLARRMYLPSDRRQHYLAEPEPWTWFRRAVRVRKERDTRLVDDSHQLQGRPTMLTDFAKSPVDRFLQLI